MKYNDLELIHPLISRLLNEPPPNLKEVILPNNINGVNIKQELQNSMHNPINSKRLKEIVKEGDTIGIIALDDSRFAPQREMIEEILKEIDYVKDENIFIMIANGTHKKIDPKVLDLGKNILSRFKIYNHDAKNTDELIEIGKIPSKFNEFNSTLLRDNDLELLSDMCCNKDEKRIFKRENLLSEKIVRINKKIFNADVIVLLGSIKPHYFAGYSGGVKSLIPGVVDRYFIIRNHLLKIHPNSDLGVMEGNLVHEELKEATKLLTQKKFCLNVILNKNREIIKAFSGDVIEAHRKGVEYAKQFFEVKAKKADVIIISDADPVTMNVKQIKKVVGTARKVVKQNGIIIVVGDCKKGLGSSSKINDVIFKLYLRNKLPKNVSLFLISDLNKTELEMSNFFKYCPSLEYALNFACQKLGEKWEMCIVPFGTLVIPITESEVI